MANTRLGKYELHEELGRGGFGTVYRATDTVLGREVALKVLHPQLAVDLDFIQRFRNEAKMIASLEDPGIVTIYELDEESGRMFIAMRYLPGGSLRDKLQKEGRLSFERALQIIKQVSSALQSAHEEGLIHRDIKPENILFAKDGHAVISDFGLAKSIQSSSYISSGLGSVGTPPYTAPEIWEGKQISPASDQYSLACVLYEMLTGQVLFKGNTPPEIMTRHMLNGPQFPASWPEGVPGETTKILARALDRDPAKRYQDVTGFANALEGSLRAEVTPTPETPLPTPRSGKDARDDSKPKARAQINKIPGRNLSTTKVKRKRSESKTRSNVRPNPSKAVAGLKAVDNKKIERPEAGASSALTSIYNVFRGLKLDGILWASIIGLLLFVVILAIWLIPHGKPKELNIFDNLYYFTSDQKGGRAEIYRFNLVNGQLDRVTNTSGQGQSWSPFVTNEGMLYYTSDSQGNKDEIYRINLHNGQLDRVTNTPAQGQSWSPFVTDDGMLYYTSNQQDSKAEIYRIDLHNGKLERVTNTPGKSQSWSPFVTDTGMLYYTSDQQDNKAEIYRVDLHNGKLERVTNTPLQGESWSPFITDTGVLYYTSDQQDNKSEIYRINLHNGQLDRVTKTSGQSRSWAPFVTSGGMLYYTSDQQDEKAEIYRIDLHSGQLERVTYAPEGHNSLLSPLNENRPTSRP